MHADQGFKTAYATLDPKQREAVDAVEGPVMVLAGPGTGKTHVLTLRIANILATTSAKPDEILALTFTDSAARTMRRRLALIIGEAAAGRVTITTFHGFAELVRTEYPASFAATATRRLMGDVEQKLLFREAIDTTPLDQLRPARAPYTYLPDLERLHDACTREGVTLAAYQAWGDAAKAALEEDESLRYKRGSEAGKLTKAGASKLARFDKVAEAVRVLERYEALKEERGVYDFAGLLASTVDTIAQDESLRADLQERFQYVLADEHQDANALQHRLLELFAYDDQPNLFVVGDEKQAIYRFQGADLGGFRSFTELFPKAKVISLESSFRSYQPILDLAHEVVADTGTHVRLRAARGTGTGATFSRITAEDPLDEQAKIAALTKSLLAAGTPPEEIAIIARTNDTADLLALALSASGVPVLRAGDLGLESRPVMRALMALASYVADPLRTGSLRQALLAPWWPGDLHGRLMLLRTASDRELVAKLAAALPTISASLETMIAAALAKTPIETFSFLFATSGARDFLLSHAEHLEDIALVRRLMMHLEEASLLSGGATFAGAMDLVQKASEHGLSAVKRSVVEREGFVTLITAHKAKGMEFKEVIIPDATEEAWEKGGRAALIPTPFEAAQTSADAKRLLYVALTRAKDHVYLSAARESASGRERTPTTLLPLDMPETVISSESLPQLHRATVAPKLVTELVAHYLETEGLSPSALSEYLESPATFFARRVLRVSEPPTPALVYGSAVHAALAVLLDGGTAFDADAALERVFARSLLPRDATFEKLRGDARAAVVASAEALPPLGTPEHIEKKFSVTRLVDGEAVRLEGKIDAAFKTSDGLVVADFKTGSSVSAKNEDYVRQLALYAELLAENGSPVEEAWLLGVSEEGLKKVPVPVGATERTHALAEVDTVIRELRTGKWRAGEASPYDAVLALLRH